MFRFTLPGSLTAHVRRRHAPPVRLDGRGHDPQVAQVRRRRGLQGRRARRDRDGQGQHDLRGRRVGHARDRGQGGRHARRRRDDLHRSARAAAGRRTTRTRTKTRRRRARGRRATRTRPRTQGDDGDEDEADERRTSPTRKTSPKRTSDGRGRRRRGRRGSGRGGAGGGARADRSPSPSPASERVKASPIARRMASDRASTCPRSRAAARAGGSSSPTSRPRPTAASPSPSPRRTKRRGARSAPARDGEAGRGDIEHVELNRLQRTVARRMAESKATAPDFVMTLEVDMEEAVELRAQLKAAAGDAPAPSFNDFVIKAAALALRDFPRANGAYRDGQFELYSRVNVGVAVAGQDALVVPTVFDADRRASARSPPRPARLAERVREGKITPPELSGRHVHDLQPRHVRHPPLRGGDQPAAGRDPGRRRALAAAGRARRRGRRPHAMELTLTCDHRILYGAEAAEFLAADPRVPRDRRCGSLSRRAPERSSARGTGRGSRPRGLVGVDEQAERALLRARDAGAVALGLELEVVERRRGRATNAGSLCDARSRGRRRRPRARSARSAITAERCGQPADEERRGRSITSSAVPA